MYLQTPDSWTKVWPGPAGAVQYLHSVIARVSALASLKEGGTTGIDLATVFHPEVFFGSLRHQASR